MSKESPPPYSVAVADFSVTLPVSESEAGLPFNRSEVLASTIQTLISEGQKLDSHFKDVRDVASAGAQFECQELALVLSQRFETLLWESRNIAGVALVAIKDFNEIVLDFLSQPDVGAQDRLKELANTSKFLQRERLSVTDEKSSFDVLLSDLWDFHQSIHFQSSAIIPKRRRRSRFGGQGTKGTPSSGKLRPPIITPCSGPVSGLSTFAASLGAISRTCIDYALQFERIAEQAMFPPHVVNSVSQAPARDTIPGTASSNGSECERLCFAVEHVAPEALPSLVDALLHDLRAFVGQFDVFDTVFTELARAQDIFVVYLKDGQSIANQGYRHEINRLRRHLPCVCNALDAYSKAESL